MKHAHAAVVACALLAACDSQDDLPAWMAQIRQRHHTAPAPLPPAAIPALFRYEPGTRSDPFGPVQLDPADDAAPGNGLQPDLRRVREPLESYPLGALRLVGSLRRPQEAIALVEVERRVYMVRVGSHLGQDFGTVVAIGERTVDIDELIPDSGGRWSRRRTKLELQETR